jgi:hypothetical protein
MMLHHQVQLQEVVKGLETKAPNQNLGHYKL